MHGTLLDCDDVGFVDDVLGGVRRNTGQAVVHGISVALTFCCRAMAARRLSHALDAATFLRRADERGSDVLGISWKSILTTILFL